MHYLRLKKRGEQPMCLTKIIKIEFDVYGLSGNGVKVYSENRHGGVPDEHFISYKELKSMKYVKVKK